ncbi:DUF262 and DUF1524 domain-containing protein [Dysgonomonas capnocytophagoides]|uniref:DUF262 and DUF1524 domain-containing protein n=1 Tax=Dysgonomonas capnocytophagoides TaxID=45254 RepID=UPI00291C8E18|nr:DUF262 and DUF1524 domain-containing protein [Dysgonomonas capnocytophagoides]
MKASEANLLTVLKAPHQFVIPIYQRTYNWSKPQCQQLFSDILSVSRDMSMQGHFIGSIVYFQESIHTISDIPQLLVIDGQQRLTTVSLLIAALADFLKNNEVEIDTTYSKLQNYYLFNSQEDNELRYKLLLTKRDKDTYLNLIKGIEQPEKHSIRIVENYNYFRDSINSSNVADVYNGLLRLFIVNVALEKDKDNPQLIFESMNSTGLDLSQADLIRNYILMRRGIDEQAELYEKYWFPMEQSYGNDYTTLFDKFVRDYLAVKTGSIPKIGFVYEAFKSYVKNTNSIDIITDVVKDIHKFSKYYVNMVIHKEPDAVLKESFKRISQLKVDVSYPYLLPVYNDYNDGIISKEEFNEVICMVENYVFRRVICGIPTNSLNKTFENLYKSVNKDNYIESVKASFLLLDGYKRFPNDVEFENALMVKDVYNLRNRNYMFSKLENYKRKEVVNISDYTIEHIMPQNPDLREEWKLMLGDNWQDIQDKYLHTLGNLTLTGYNSELSDRPFAEKKTIEGGFNDSPLRMNEYLRTVNKWDKDEIEKRAEELAEKAKTVWTIPFLPDEILSSYKPDENTPVIYTVNSYEYLNGEMLELYKELRKRILNINPAVREEFKKLYIAFKAETNFVDIVPQKSRLRLSLNLSFDEVIDPKGLCKDVSDLGRWGNGDVEVGISHLNELNDVLELIQQAFDKQMD